MRILSLLPSATEIVCALGAEGDLVGRSQECDYPSTVARLPVVMHARSLDVHAPSTEIDARVTRARGRGESLYRLDLDRIRSLRPDVILTQDLCGVCSVTDTEVREACALAGVSPQLVSLTPRRLEDVWANVLQVGEAIDRPREGERLARALRARSSPSLPPGRPKGRVAVVEWLDPPILAGLWTPDIVSQAGGRSVGPAAGEAGQRLTWESLAATPPDLAILAPCSFTVDRTAAELGRLSHQPALAHFLANVPTFLADEAYFSRPGPRLADGVALVAQLLRDGEAIGPMPVARWHSPVARVAA